MPPSALSEESAEILTSAEESLTILGTELFHAEKETAVTWNIFFFFLIQKIFPLIWIF